MSADFSITTEEMMGKSPVTVFHIRGDIDSNTYMELQGAAEEAYRAGKRNFLLDLTEVNFISSAGLRALHVIYTMLRDPVVETDEMIRQGIRDGSYKSPHLKLLKVSKNADAALKVAGFDMYLESFKDLKEAVASF